MKIPRSFELYGRTIRVITSDDLQAEAVGLWESDRDLITIDADSTKDSRAHSFLHECCHAWLEALGRDDLTQDEKFVDSLSGLIHQMLKTSK